jgi:hypothetical protein
MTTELDLHDFFMRVWTNLLERPSGPLAFRFLLQPTMAAALAIRDGVRDARSKTTPYLWRVVFDSGNRVAHLREGLKATNKVIFLAVVLDVAYQAFILKEFYLGEALLVAVTLGFVPYIFIRGPTARAVRLFRGAKRPNHA